MATEFAGLYKTTHLSFIIYFAKFKKTYLFERQHDRERERPRQRAAMTRLKQEAKNHIWESHGVARTQPPVILFCLAGVFVGG